MDYCERREELVDGLMRMVSKFVQSVEIEVSDTIVSRVVLQE